jgi:peptide/nickel transport system substrate-binding protein
MMFFIPSHYLKKFHKEHVDPDTYKKELEAAGYAEKDWAKYYVDYGWGAGGPNAIMTAKIGCPVLTPFVVKENPSVGVWIAERNPYYFEVDQAGRQLPYIDSIRIEQVNDAGMLTMKAMAGEIDYLRESMSTLDYPMLKENEANSTYKVFPLTKHDEIFFHLNFGYEKDPGWMALANNRKFRQALNYAIDSQEILDTLYLGMAKLSTRVPPEVDLSKANALLDEIGMTSRDSAGFRLRPDGKPYQIDFEYGKLADEFPPFVEMIQQDFAKIGIRVIPKQIDVSLWSQRRTANDIQTPFFWTDFAVCEGNPAMWLWSILGRSSPLYTTYYNSQGRSGTPPVGDVLDIYQKTFDLQNSKTMEEVAGNWSDIKKLLWDSCIWFIPVENATSPVIYSGRLGNIVEEGFMFTSNMDLSYAYFQ